MNPLEIKQTPMMLQWHECKAKAQEAILFFRLGDFYEAFYEDAVLCSEVLDLTLTKRQQVPMSGIPFHAADGYIDKLIAKGYKVALAEQIGDPKSTKGILKREIQRIITPATLQTSTLLNDKSNNYFAAISQVGQIYGLAFFDLTCADCRIYEAESLHEVVVELARIQPKEILTSTKILIKNAEVFKEIKERMGCLIDSLEDWHFDHQLCYQFLVQTLKVHTLDGFGLKGKVAGINAAGALLAYIQDHLYQSLSHLQRITSYSKDSFMAIDPATLSHLELIESKDRSRKNTLLEVIDNTLTPMGGRLLKRWLLQPLLEIDEIEKRQLAIQELLEDSPQQKSLSVELGAIRDLERLITKISTGYASPRDFLQLKHSLIPLPRVIESLKDFTSEHLKKAQASIGNFDTLIELLEKSIVDEPPLRSSEGGIFKAGYHAELDELRLLTHDSKTWMAHYQVKLREDTGIKTLKVGFSSIAGFYIEVTKGQAEKVPSSFERRQTMTNAERYITAELKIFEQKILSAEELMIDLEESLFKDLKEKVALSALKIYETASIIACIDCFLSLAQIAKNNNYVKPLFDDSFDLEIQEGRHPVIEIAKLKEKFIPNDTYLNCTDQKLMLITGPNMAGKSTYIRQVALIVILAHIGSFVPAKSLRLGIIDKVFTRIGASDDLARGQSTFMVEMTETAYILNQSTDRSLVILDEIGRGTSTYDGIALAWSISEHLLNKSPKTLFASHYWELTQLQDKIAGAVNFHVAVHESGDHVVFLRKIVKGKTNKSYGIYVGKLAGLPPSVLSRATEILEYLEENSNQKSVFEVPKPKRIAQQKKTDPKEIQLAFLT